MRVIKVDNPGTPEEEIKTVVKYNEHDKVKRATKLAASLNKNYASRDDSLEFRAVPQERPKSG